MPLVDLGSIRSSLTLDLKNFLGNIKLADKSIDDLQDSLNGLKKASNDSAKTLTRDWDKIGSKLKSTGEDIRSVGHGLTTGLTAPIVGTIGGAATAAISFQSAFTGVKKTVEATPEQFKELRQNILDMSDALPIGANELSRLGEVGGQLGIEFANLPAFIRTMADLGVATHLTGEQAGTALSRLANITGIGQKSFDRMGSTLVHLGNNLETTEGEILNMALRIAAAGRRSGLSTAQIMGLAGAMSSLGIKSELGGSSISRIMIEISRAVTTGGDALTLFAATAGMSAAQFAEQWRSDAVGALQQFLIGLNASGEQATFILDELGLDAVRVTDVITRMALGHQKVAEGQELATTSWAENLALTKEAQQRYATIESQLKTLAGQIWNTAVMFGTELFPIIEQFINDVGKPFVHTLREWVKWFKELNPETQKTILGIAGLAAALGPTVFVMGTFVGQVGNLLKLFGPLKKILPHIKKGMTGIFAGGGPIMLGLTAMVAGVALLVDNTKKLTKLVDEANRKSKGPEITGTTAQFGKETQAFLEGKELPPIGVGTKDLTTLHLDKLEVHDMLEQVDKAIAGRVEKTTVDAPKITPDFTALKKLLTGGAKETADDSVKAAKAITERELAAMDAQMANLGVMRNLSLAQGKDITPDELAAMDAQMANLPPPEDVAELTSVADEFGKETGDAFARGFARTMANALNNLPSNLGNMRQWAQNLFQGLSQQFLKPLTDKLQESIAKMVTGMQDKLGMFGMAAIGGALAGLSMLFNSQKDEVQALGNEVKGNIESVERTRGLIAGQQSIAIAQLSQNLGMAMRPVHEVLLRIEAILRGQPLTPLQTDMVYGSQSIAVDVLGSSRI